MKLGKKVIKVSTATNNQVRWKLLTNKRVINCINKLLKGEAISQIENNCELSRLANIILEIRKLIGFESIENYQIVGAGQSQAYKLVSSDEVKNKLLAVRDEIYNQIEAKNL